MKKVDNDEETFAGKVLVDDKDALPEKELDIEACGQLFTKGQFLPQSTFSNSDFRRWYY